MYLALNERSYPLLLIGESPNKRKALLTENIKFSRLYIRSLRNSDDDLAEDLIDFEKKLIKYYFNEMILLERWRIRNNYKPNEEYNPRKK